MASMDAEQFAKLQGSSKGSRAIKEALGERGIKDTGIAYRPRVHTQQEQNISMNLNGNIKVIENKVDKLLKPYITDGYEYGYESLPATVQGQYDSLMEQHKNLVQQAQGIGSDVKQHHINSDTAARYGDENTVAVIDDGTLNKEPQLTEEQLNSEAFMRGYNYEG